MSCIPMQIKPIKAYQGKGHGALPLREWRAMPFPPQDSVARVNLSRLSHNAVHTAGRCPHQDIISQASLQTD